MQAVPARTRGNCCKGVETAQKVVNWRRGVSASASSVTSRMFRKFLVLLRISAGYLPLCSAIVHGNPGPNGGRETGPKGYAEDFLRRPAKPLSAKFVQTVRTPGKYYDGHGLFLRINENGTMRTCARP